MLIISILIAIIVILSWYMLYRYTEHYKELKNEFKTIIEQNRKPRISWGETPKHERTGKGMPVTYPPARQKLPADEPQLLLGGLSYMEAQKASLRKQCEIMDELEIKNVEDYHKWYEKIKYDESQENALRIVSGCVQEGVFAKNRKKKTLEDSGLII